MEEIPLNSWAEFQGALDSLSGRIRANSDRVREVARINFGRELSLPFNPSNTLFRGQRDAQWNLETTLERQTGQPLNSISAYLRTIRSEKPEIETYTGESWSIPDDVADALVAGLVRYHAPDPLPLYAYMAYLRHHGFPSPLLDWTSSPYIAAYFAFEDSRQESERVAIFAYVETIGAGKGGISGNPYIFSLGPKIRVNKRHFVQRSEYTVCYITPNSSPDELPRLDELNYGRHDAVFSQNEPEQDLLFKITLPSCERRNALRYLDLHNITRYSLFETTDSLMQSLAVRAYVVDE